MTEAGEYFWLRTVGFFLSDLFEHFKPLYMKSDAWIFHCELFVSYPHSVYLLNMYMDGYFLKRKKKSDVAFYAKESVWWLCKQRFFSGQPEDISVCLDFFFFDHSHSKLD